MNQIDETEPKPSRLAFPQQELRVAFDYNATTSMVVIPIKNNGDETLTVVGSGWSYPFRAFDAAVEPRTFLRPSLDVLFARPVPIVSGATVNITLELEVNEAFTAESPAFGCIGLFSDSDAAFCPVRLCLLPDIKILTDKFTVKEPKKFPIVVILQSESELPDPARVHGLGADWEIKRVTAQQLQISCKWQPPAHFLHETRHEPISVWFKGIPHVLVHPVQVTLHRCGEPALALGTETPLVLNQGRQKVFQFQLTNVGADELTITDVVAIQPASGLALVPHQGLVGLRLGSQKCISVPVVVMIPTADGDTSFGLQVFTDSPSLPIIELRQRVEVVRFARLSSPIGFDFGTVNSCVGFVDEAFMEATLVKVPVEMESGKFSPEEIFPSVLNMETMPSEDDSAPYEPMLSFITRRRDTINVHEAKSFFCRGERLAVRCADGIERKFPSGHFISQFLANLLSHTEHQLKGTFSDAVITVPTKYGRRTVDEMQTALAAIGFQKDHIHVYDESTSAAMFYIRRGRDSEFLRAYHLPENYAIVIMDVGGGTTDISILDVADRESVDTRHLEVTLRGTTGRIRFGGAHFNRRIEERWFTDYLAAGAELGVTLQRPDQLDFEQAQELLGPRAELAEAIEVAKCHLANRPMQHYAKIDRALTCYRTLSRESLEDIDTEKLPTEVTNLCRATVDDLLGRDLSDILAEVELMAASLAKHPLGVVLLVGQSSQLQTVRDAVIRTFGADKIALVSAETAKSCVVQGALELHQLLSNPGGVAFKFRDLSRVLSARIGMLWSGRYEMEFKEILPIGVDLPAEGKLELPDHLLDKAEVFSVELLSNYGAKDTIKGNENIARLGRYVCATPRARGEKQTLTVRADENNVLTVTIQCGGQSIELQREE